MRKIVIILSLALFNIVAAPSTLAESPCPDQLWATCINSGQTTSTINFAKQYSGELEGGIDIDQVNSVAAFVKKCSCAFSPEQKTEFKKLWPSVMKNYRAAQNARFDGKSCSEMRPEACNEFTWRFNIEGDYQAKSLERSLQFQRICGCGDYPIQQSHFRENAKKLAPILAKWKAEAPQRLEHAAKAEEAKKKAVIEANRLKKERAKISEKKRLEEDRIEAENNRTKIEAEAKLKAKIEEEQTKFYNEKKLQAEKEQRNLAKQSSPECKVVRTERSYCADAITLAIIQNQIDLEQEAGKVSGFVDAAKLQRAGTSVVLLRKKLLEKSANFKAQSGKELQLSDCPLTLNSMGFAKLTPEKVNQLESMYSKNCKSE